MSKIAIDARIIRTSTGRYIERLLTYLQDVDKENEYYILVRKPELDYWKPKNKNFKVVEANYGDFGFAEQLKLLRQLNKLQPDLVHFCMPQHPILYRGKFVSTIHDLTMFLPIITPGSTLKNPLVFRFKKIVFGFVFNHAARRAKYVIAPSRSTKKGILERTSRVDPEKIKITYESADRIKGTPAQVKKLKGKQYVMFVGRAWPYKNIRLLIDAYAIAKKKHPSLLLALAGKKESFYNELEAYAKSKKIKDIHFLGFVSDAQLKWLYQNTTAYVFPSLAEGFGLPGMEAIVHDAPVLASNATCLPEVYGEGALYFDPYDAKDLADKIDKVLTHPSLRRELKAAGRKQAKKYSWKKMAEETQDIYLEALKESVK